MSLNDVLFWAAVAIGSLVLWRCVLRFILYYGIVTIVKIVSYSWYDAKRMVDDKHNGKKEEI